MEAIHIDHRSVSSMATANEGYLMATKAARLLSSVHAIFTCLTEHMVFWTSVQYLYMPCVGVFL